VNQFASAGVPEAGGAVGAGGEDVVAIRGECLRIQLAVGRGRRPG
jgi:hypothetical protein